MQRRTMCSVLLAHDARATPSVVSSISSVVVRRGLDGGRGEEGPVDSDRVGRLVVVQLQVVRPSVHPISEGRNSRRGQLKRASGRAGVVRAASRNELH